MTTKIDTKESIVEAIGNLTVVELSELVKLLEEKFGVQAAVPAVGGGVVSQVGTQPGAQVQEEKTEFNVVLTNSGQNKIPVIKFVREITGLGLKESKDLVDNLPKVVKENVPKQQAEEFKKKFSELGATVELK